MLKERHQPFYILHSKKVCLYALIDKPPLTGYNIGIPLLEDFT